MNAQLVAWIAEGSKRDSSELALFLNETNYDPDLWDEAIDLVEDPDTLIALIKQFYCNYEELFFLTVKRLTELL